MTNHKSKVHGVNPSQQTSYIGKQIDYKEMEDLKATTIPTE